MAKVTINYYQPGINSLIRASIERGGRWRCGYYTHKRVAHQRKCLVEKPKKKKKIRRGKKTRYPSSFGPFALSAPGSAFKMPVSVIFAPSRGWMYRANLLSAARGRKIFFFLFRWLIGIRLSPFVYDRFDYIFSTFCFCIRVWPQYFQQFVTLAIESRSWVF